MILFKTHTDLDTVIEAASSAIINTQQASLVGFQVNATVNSTAGTFNASTAVSVAYDTITITAHGYYTGQVGQFTITGSLPTGISTLTNYYIVVIDANTIQVASSLINALAIPAVPVNITAVGSNATATFTPISLSGCSYKLQHSADYDYRTSSGNWTDAVSGETNTVVTNTITTSANSFASLINNCFPYVRILFAISAGSVKIQVISHTKSR